MPNNPFVIVVADHDPIVEVISARLLSSALETTYTTFPTHVRVLSTQEEIANMHEPELPTSVSAISQHAITADQSEIGQAKLVVGFSGLDVAKVNGLREDGVAAPAVNLCQFALNLDAVADGFKNQDAIDVRDVIVGAALQFGFGGGSTQCEICADKVGDSIDYWINIADTCARFAQSIKKLQKQN